ncbi:hypothetical protein [Tunicatimonas pelagia]|uniref:hypothetical protein n=1 Tax=Tunicatimonas pelagia TaxID=931531 RepID=UPI0026666A91|nr:hypothetical protein [Tunicatimonas pelagia]WKN41104.1 hypothetical protein P0M28_18895 [Tunicatimonas pelagia]
MKYFIFSLLLLFTACSTQEDADLEASAQESDSEQEVQKWQLVEMSGNIANVPPTTGDNMSWQEFYLLQSDNTFKKVREQYGETKEASGTYEYVTLSDGEYLELTYSSENNLIGNCSGETNELLFVESENTLIGTWRACDGPGLVYEKAGSSPTQ